MTSRQNEGRMGDSTIQWFRFPDGGTYVGPVSYGLAQGLAVAVGSRGIGEFSGLYQAGYETLGVLRTVSVESNGQARPDGPVNSYSGEWSGGRRHGLGVDLRDGWVFRGEWTQGFRGRYGVRHNVGTSVGYEGTWTSGVQDGFGVEIYADGGTYCGQWMKGMRHGYGVRQSATYPAASKYRSAPSFTPQPTSQSQRSTLLKNPADSLVALRDQRVLTGRGGFVLLAETSFPALPRKRGLLIDRHGRPSLSKTISHQLKMRGMSSGNFSRSSSFRSVGSRSSGGSIRSAIAADEVAGSVDDDTVSFISQDISAISNVQSLRETYRGEWKHDRRNGYGVCERTDGLKYEGEWVNNQKHGYGCTTLPGGTKVSGKYRNNVLVASVTTKGVLAPFQGNKIIDRVAFAVDESIRATRQATEKEEIARIRMKGARERALLADNTAARANVEAEAGRAQAVRIMSNNQSSTDIDMSIHRPSEREFYLEIDPTDKDFSYLGSQTTKKKRFQLSIGRSRAGSLSMEQQGSDMKDFATNQLNTNRPHSHIETLTNTEFNNEPTLARGQIQHNQNEPTFARGQTQHNQNEPTFAWGQTQQNQMQSVQPGPGSQHQPPTYTFERNQQPTVNRLSSVPGDDYLDDYRTSDVSRTRRKSLPSIVKEKVVEKIPPMYYIDIDPDIPSAKNTSTARAGAGKAVDDNLLTQPRLSVKRVDTYVIENGVRKLVKNTKEDTIAKSQGAGSIPAKSDSKAGGALSHLIKQSFHAATAAPRAHVSVEEQFKDMYRTESPAAAWKKRRGSTPDITAALNVRIPPREEVYVLSQRRREEIIQERAERERTGKIHIVLSFFDIKRWISEHLLFVCFMFINVLAAILLFKS